MSHHAPLTHFDFHMILYVFHMILVKCETGRLCIPSPDFESDSRLFYLSSNTTNLSRIDPRLLCRWISPVSYTRCMALRACLIPKLTLLKNISVRIYNQKYAKNPMAWLVCVSFLCEQQQACASSKVCAALRCKSLALREQHLEPQGRRHEYYVEAPSWFAGELIVLVTRFPVLHQKIHTDSSAHSTKKIIRSLYVSFCPPLMGCVVWMFISVCTRSPHQFGLSISYLKYHAVHVIDCT